MQSDPVQMPAVRPRRAGSEELGRCEEEEEERLRRRCGRAVGQWDIPRGWPGGAGMVRALLERQTWEPDQPWGKPG